MQLTNTLLNLLDLLLLLPALLAAHPIASPTLEKRGIGWIEGRGDGAYKCMYWGGIFFDQYHMAGIRADFGEKELKKTVKKSGAMTAWKYKQDAPGSYKADVSLSCPFSSSPCPGGVFLVVFFSP